ncbi:MAG: hypothetical protein WBA88_21705 [Pseudaminobacter sp.]
MAISSSEELNQAVPDGGCSSPSGLRPARRTSIWFSETLPLINPFVFNTIPISIRQSSPGLPVAGVAVVCRKPAVAVASGREFGIGCNYDWIGFANPKDQSKILVNPPPPTSS